MNKIKLAVTGCLGRMGNHPNYQSKKMGKNILFSKLDKKFKLVTLKFAEWVN